MIVEKRTFIVGSISLAAISIGLIWNETIVFWCMDALLLALCLYAGHKEEQLLNPYYLFAITPFSLLIYKNISNSYMQDLKITTWVIAIINIAAFIFAMLLTPSARVEGQYYSEKRELRFNTIVLAIVGIAPTILFSLLGIAIPFYSIFGLLSIPALCCAIVSKSKKLIAGVFALMLLTWLNNVTKSTILTTCLCIVICYEFCLSDSKKAKRKLFRLCIVSLVIILFAFTFANQARGAKSASSQLGYYMQYGNVRWTGLAALFMPYMYLETPWTNLQYVMQTQNTRTYGLWMIKPLLNYLQMDGLFEKMYQLIPMSSFNTYAFVTCNFKDFGIWGSVIPSVLLGCYVKWVYSRAYQTKNPLDVACYIYVAQAVLEMFFSNHFFQQAYPLTCVLLVGIYKQIARRCRK